MFHVTLTATPDVEDVVFPSCMLKTVRDVKMLLNIAHSECSLIKNIVKEQNKESHLFQIEGIICLYTNAATLRNKVDTLRELDNANNSNTI